MNLIKVLESETNKATKAEVKELNRERNQAKRVANKQHKENTLSLFGLINYMSKEFFNETGELATALDFARFNYATNRKEFKEVCTIDYLKECLGEKGLHKWHKDPETNKRTVKGEAKHLFGFYSVLSAIQKHERE